MCNVEKSCRILFDHPVSGRVYYLQLARGEPMKSRQILIAIAILSTVWHTAEAQPKKRIEVDPTPPESILAGTSLSSILSIRFDCVQAGSALGPRRRPQILRNRHEHRDRQDIGRFLCDRAGPTNKSDYPRTDGISFAAKISGGNDAVSGT